jgi:hypothetical protein
MEQLSKTNDAFVRPSPTRGVLGGIAEHTSDVILLCEGGGYEVVFVESVGLGQSEVAIDQAVDMLLLLVGGVKNLAHFVCLALIAHSTGRLVTSCAVAFSRCGRRPARKQEGNNGGRRSCRGKQGGW